MLYGSDIALSFYLPEYQHSGQYRVALSIFLVVGAAFLLLGKSRGWSNWRYYIFGPIAVFLPLVFIGTSVRFIFGIENAFTAYHIVQYCSGSEEMCGRAFAYVFFSMSLRAAPTIFIVGPLFYLVYRRVFPDIAAIEA